MQHLHTFAAENLVHAWLHQIHLAVVPGRTTPLLEQVTSGLLDTFRGLGHTVQAQPDGDTDLIITSAPFAQPLNWRDSLLFTARRRFRLTRSPTILTLIHARPSEFQSTVERIELAVKQQTEAPVNFGFEGLAPTAFPSILQQGLRGGPVLGLARVLQAQAKSIRILLVVGEETPQEAYLFDLVGAHPRLDANEAKAFYEDVVLRVVTGLSTEEVTQHRVAGESIPQSTWRGLSTPRAMLVAARELGKRGFFTPLIRVADLVPVPALDAAIAEQYSEGCFATWEPQLNALIATITGSARPVSKDNITENELAVIVGVRPDGKGAMIRHVENKRNDPPSSEAVEMMALDGPLPKNTFQQRGSADDFQVPVARSKLHGHRGVAAYHPQYVEFVPLDPPYYNYPVSCATEAQANGIRRAFARSEALLNPADPRQIVFTVLPGHGLVAVEKWQSDKAPFQLIWEYMDAGFLQIESRVPQGWFSYEPEVDGQHHLRLLE